MRRALCAVRCALCAVRCALCAVRRALCAVRRALCAVRRALGAMLRDLQSVRTCAAHRPPVPCPTVRTSTAPSRAPTRVGDTLDIGTPISPLPR